MQPKSSFAVVIGASFLMFGVLAVVGQLAGAGTIGLAGWMLGAGSAILFLHALFAILESGAMPVVGAGSLLAATIFNHEVQNIDQCLVVAVVGLLVFPSAMATTRTASRWMRRFASLSLVLAIIVLAMLESDAGPNAVYGLAACWGFSFLCFCVAMIGNATAPALSDEYLPD